MGNLTLTYPTAIGDDTFHQSYCTVLWKFNKPKVQWLSRHIGYISIEALHLRLVSCKSIRLDCEIVVFPTILPSPPPPLQKKDRSLHVFTLGYHSGLNFSLLGISILLKSSGTGHHVQFFSYRQKSSKHAQDLMSLNTMPNVVLVWLKGHYHDVAHRRAIFHWHTLSQECFWSRSKNSPNVFYRV